MASPNYTPMNVHSSSSHSENVHPQSNDEIDLKELFTALWQGKWWVIGFTILGAALAITYALTAQQWWSSKALVAMPQQQDVAQYRQQVKQFQPVFDIYQDDGTVLVSEELDDLVDPEILFDQFVSAFNSTNNKRRYLNSSTEFKEFKADLEIADGDDSEQAQDAIRKLYSEWFERISATKLNPKDEISPYTLSLQSIGKNSSYDLLTGYLEMIDVQTHEDALNNLKAVVSAKKNELAQQKNILMAQAKARLSVEAEKAEYALGIAEAADIRQPIQSGDGSELFSIDMGSKALDAKVKALNSIKNLSIIEPRLEQINAKLTMLDNLKVDTNINFQTYKILEDIEKPVSRDKPKRALIAILGTLLGGMLGVAIVLIRFAFRKQPD